LTLEDIINKKNWPQITSLWFLIHISMNGKTIMYWIVSEPTRSFTQANLRRLFHLFWAGRLLAICFISIVDILFFWMGLKVSFEGSSSYFFDGCFLFNQKCSVRTCIQDIKRLAQHFWSTFHKEMWTFAACIKILTL